MRRPGRLFPRVHSGFLKKFMVGKGVLLKRTETRAKKSVQMSTEPHLVKWGGGLRVDQLSDVH